MTDKPATALYPVVTVEDPAASAAALRAIIPLEVAFEADWYVHLKAADSEMQVGFVRFDHASVPAADRVPARGAFITVDATDVTRLWETHRDRLDVVLPLTDEAWGQRHFIARLPGGVLLDAVQFIGG